MMKIQIGVDNTDWQAGFCSPVIWNPEKCPHLLLSGITGGGKTVLAQLIVNQLLSSDADIFICDFKAGDDWSGILSKYAEYKDCDALLNAFYESFEETIAQKQHANKFLIFDEFSSYALSKDSKDFKEMMAKISHLAFMGRSFGYHLLFISQQFNAKVLDTAIREQFGIKIYMGRGISTESATMLFPNCDIDKSVRLPCCCGYIQTPDTELAVLRIPFLSHPKGLKQLLIRKGQRRTPSGKGETVEDR